ncbi:hypothetical protein ANANG_G00163640 [Anguilla anguilla]|uniref:WH1 domain-containing protein n=1 Tax=Anguilla anguilla TaxID=7936 RepID=A0A9D3M8Q2_ANGAN|nr:hypothetical protein ANANG_G00163640 [Anguilla anguilla]
MERDVVRVRAVVMTRDDSSGGWVPLGGGGLSHVAICKGRSPGDRGRRDYCIRGERLRDRAPVLECLVRRGLVYNKVNPIFHHWRVEDQKFGLTFQSPADAISFEQGLHGVMDRLERESDSPSSSTPEEGDTEDDGQASRTGSESSSNSRKEMLPKPVTIVTSESSSPCFALPSAAEDYGYGAQHGVTTQTPAQIHIRPVQLQPPQTSAADKSELCVVRFGKEQAGAGEGTVTLDTKASQRLSSSSSPTPNTVTSPPASDSSRGSPSCCLRASRTRRRGGGAGRDCGLTLGLSASPSTSGGAAGGPRDEGPCPAPPSPAPPAASTAAPSSARRRTGGAAAETPGPRPSLLAPLDVRLVRREPALPLHLRPRGRVLGTLLVRGPAGGAGEPAVLRPLGGSARPLPPGALHVLLPAPVRLPALRGAVRLLRGEAQGRPVIPDERAGRGGGMRNTWKTPPLPVPLRAAITTAPVPLNLSSNIPQTVALIWEAFFPFCAPLYSQSLESSTRSKGCYWPGCPWKNSAGPIERPAPRRTGATWGTDPQEMWSEDRWNCVKSFST